LVALAAPSAAGADAAGTARGAVPSAEVQQPSLVRSFATLSGLRVVARGGRLAPVLAPDGDRVLFSDAGFGGLFVASLVGDPQIRQLSAAPRAGYRPVWRADGRAVGLRPRHAPFASARLEAIAVRGDAAGTFEPTPGLAAIQKDDCIYLAAPRRSLQIACGGDKYFAPQLAADRRHVVYCGLRRGVLLYRVADGSTIALGAGHQPALSGDGRLLAFVRATDDGEQLTSADLWLTDLRDPAYRTAPLTSTPGRLEEHPSLSRDGTTLAFSASGEIAVGRLALQPLRPR
jgi:hypothetical protein